MHSFRYQNDRLHCEDVDLAALAQEHGTPLYVYSGETIQNNFRRLDQALAPLRHHVCYALKANSNLAILELLAKEGAGFDIVSGGELYRVLAAGGKAEHCTFAGVGKTAQEIEYALDQGIFSFNVESEAEVEAIQKIAAAKGVIAPVAFRVNPNVDAQTHQYISTGKSENKFGIDFEFIEAVCERAQAHSHIRLRGLQMHIGSQLTQVSPFVEAVERVGPLVARLKEKYDIEFFSIGGGIGIVYDPALASGSPDWWAGQSDEERPLTAEEYATQLVPLLEPLGVKILLEPGRYLVGNAGVLLTRILYTKRGTAKTFQIVDAGMNDLIRPALYQGHHEIVPLKAPRGETECVDIVGPVCESGDFFGQNLDAPKMEAGEGIALLSSGAYGFVMASNYNTRPMPAEILVRGSEARVVRKRQTLEELLSGEQLWQEAGASAKSKRNSPSPSLHRG
ncbi:MAG: diaminopimelate decarboxylase [Verrucomicrobiota bacterium]